jgi:(R,R)-butanediol dehydrogenase/meso-butanediol dehydrogenase/diacetyl reductase
LYFQVVNNASRAIYTFNYNLFEQIMSFPFTTVVWSAAFLCIEDVPPQQPKGSEVLIAIEWCGICGSDLHEYLHGLLIIPSVDRPHPITQSILPITMGHEFCRRVLEIPPNCVTKLKKGDAVMVDPRLYCGTCFACEKHATNECSCFGFLGISGGGGGGLSEFVAVDASACHNLREEML